MLKLNPWVVHARLNTRGHSRTHARIGRISRTHARIHEFIAFTHKRGDDFDNAEIEMDIHGYALEVRFVRSSKTLLQEKARRITAKSPDKVD